MDGPGDETLDRFDGPIDREPGTLSLHLDQELTGVALLEFALGHDVWVALGVLVGVPVAVRERVGVIEAVEVTVGVSVIVGVGVIVGVDVMVGVSIGRSMIQ